MKRIILRSKLMDRGLFGQILNWVCHVLPVLEEYDLYPEFIIPSKDYGAEEDDFNIFPKVFGLARSPEPVKELPEKFQKTITKETDEEIELQLEKVVEIFQSGKIHKSNGGQFDMAHRQFFRHFKVHDEILSKADALLGDKKTMGIHFRATDKMTDLNENPYQISFKLFVRLVEHEVAARGIEQLFIATDSERFFQLLKERLSSVVKICFHEQERFTGLRGMPFTTHNDEYDGNVHKAHMAILDSITLSKCDYTLQTNSGLSAWAKIFNPDLEINRIQHFPHDWFPIQHIPMYQCDDKSIQKEIIKLQNPKPLKKYQWVTHYLWNWWRKLRT